MPRLPDAADLGQRPAPQSSRPIARYSAGQVGDAAAGLAAVGGQIADRSAESQDRLESAYAESALLRGQLETMDELEKDNDYTTYQARYDAKMADVRKQAGEMIGDGYERQLFDARADSAIARGQAQVRAKARQKEVDFGQASLIDTLDANRDAALRAADEPTRARLFTASNQAIQGAVDRGYVPPDAAAQMRIKYAEDYATARTKLLPPDERIKALEGKAPTDAAGAIGYVIDNFEGSAPVADDGGKGASKFGINSAANPDVNVAALTREDAATIYKERYWDAVGADALPENMRLIAFDTAVNFGPEAARQMIDEAAGDPAKLAEIRTQRHAELVAKNPARYGKYRAAWEDRDARLAAMAAGKAGDFTDLLPPDKKAAMLKDAEHEYAQEEAARQKADQARRDALASDLEINVKRGRAGYEEIENNYKAGDISPAKRTELTTWLDSNAEKKAKEAAAFARVSAGLPLDPKSKEDRDALNEHFKATSAGWQASGADAAGVMDRSIEYAAQKGLVPDALQSTIRGALRGGDANAVVTASDAVRRLRSANPRVLDDFADSDLRLAETVGALTDAGFTPQESVRRANEADQVPAGVKDGRAAEYKEFVKTNKPENYLAAHLNGWLVDDPNTVPAPMTEDFNRAAALEYQRTGNMAAARAMAMNTVSRVWGASRVGADGNRYMRLPPERFFGSPNLSVQENADWINDQLAADARAAAPGLSPTKDNTSLIPVAGAGRPAYYVNVMDAGGVLRTLTRPDGTPLLWRPDFAQSEAGKAAARAQTAAVERARSLRSKKQAERALPLDEQLMPWTGTPPGRP